MLTRTLRLAVAVAVVAAMGTSTPAHETDEPGLNVIRSDNGAVIVVGELPEDWKRRMADGANPLRAIQRFNRDYTPWAEGDFAAFVRPMRAHYVGVSLGNASPTLSSHLKLDEGVGQVVMAVVDDSPAAQAGIQQHDVLVEIDGEPITSHQMVVDAVDAAGKEEAEIHVQLIREGEPQEIVIKPMKRQPPESEIHPEIQRRIFRFTPEGDFLQSDELKDFRQQLEDLRNQVEDLRKRIEK